MSAYFYTYPSNIFGRQYEIGNEFTSTTDAEFFKGTYIYSYDDLKNSASAVQFRAVCQKCVDG